MNGGAAGTGKVTGPDPTDREQDRAPAPGADREVAKEVAVKSKVASGALLFLLSVAPGITAQSLADRFPADALVYFHADTTKLVDGAMSLDLVKLLDEPQVRDFLKPLGEAVPVDGEGLRRVIDSVPWRRFVNGAVEFAVRGVHIELDGQGFDVSPAHPISARTLNRLIGASTRYADGSKPNVSVSLDFVAAIDVGEGFPQFFDEHLKEAHHLGVDISSEPCKVAGRDALKIVIAPHQEMPGQTVLLVKDGKRWWFGGSQSTLEQCLGAGTHDTLASAPAWRAFQAQVTAGDPALVAWFDVANAGRIFANCVPPIAKEECDLFGLSCVESFGYASSYVEGGVRDTFALTYNGAPTGFLSLLDCCDGGFKFLKTAPADTGLYIGARVDLAAFVEKLAKVTEELFPGSGAAFDKGLVHANHELGMDLRKELLPAFGNEIGLYLIPPGRGSMLPDGMVLLRIGDRQQFEKVLERGFTEASKNGGIAFNEMKSLPEGVKGWTVVIPDAPIQPAMAISGDTLCIAKDPLALKSALKSLKAGAGKSAADNESLQRGLTGATGAKTADGLSLLVFLDLKRAVELSYGFVPMVAGQMQQATDGKLDPANLPEPDVISRHFSALVIAGKSDAKGLTLSTFTPTGVLPLLAACGAGVAVGQVHQPLPATFGAATPAPAGPRKARAAGTKTAAPVKTEAPTELGGPDTKSPSKSRTLADLFAGIEKATGATIDFPEDFGKKEVTFAPRSGDLATILKELSGVAGFKYEIREVDGEKLVVVTGG